MKLRLTNTFNESKSKANFNFTLTPIILALSILLTLQANAIEDIPNDMDWGGRKPTIYHPQFPIKVLLAASVKKQIEQADANKKKILNQAIHVGNAFMQQHLDGTAYDFDPDYLDWTANTGAIVGMSGAEWEKLTYASGTPIPYAQLIAQNSHWSGDITTDRLKLDEKHLGAHWLVCPQLKLVVIDIKPQRIELAYETKVVGVTASNKDGSFISTDKSGTAYVVRVLLSHNQRVQNVIPQDIFGMELVLSSAYLRELSYKLTNPEMLIKKGYKPKHIKQYQEIYDTIKPASQVCQ